MLTGRCEAYLVGKPDLAMVIGTAERYSEGRRRLPLCAGHQDQGRHRRDREGGSSQTVNLLIAPPACRLRRLAISAFAAFSVGGSLARFRRGGCMNGLPRDWRTALAELAPAVEPPANRRH